MKVGTAGVEIHECEIWGGGPDWGGKFRDKGLNKGWVGAGLAQRIVAFCKAEGAMRFR